MKKYLSLLICFGLLSVQLDAQVSITPKESVSTGILYDLAYPVSGIERFDGIENIHTNTLKNWRQIYFELSASSLDKSDYSAFSETLNGFKPMINDGIIPIGIIYYRYNHLNQNLENFQVEENHLDFSNTLIPEKTVFTSAALKKQTYNGNNLNFVLRDDLIFSNLPVKPVSFLMDFDDGKSWQEIAPGATINVSYITTGFKTISLKVTLEDGKELMSSFQFEVLRLETPDPTTTWNVQGEIPYNGATTSGDAFVYLAEGNSSLVKPAVICEGIDFDDSFGWEDLYDLFNQQNLLEDLRAEGFDVVILNFHQPLTYVQQNGFLMVKLIQMVNDTIEYQMPIVVVGPSMGGLVTRYALTYMENEGLDHNAALYISFETPNQGANITLGLQYELFFFKDLVEDIQLLLDILDGPAAKQMLAYHYTNPPSTTAGPDALFGIFQNELTAMGDYPDNLRKISISNGRGDAVGQPYNAGDQVIDYNFSNFLVTIKGNVWSVKDNGTNQIFEGKLKILFVSDDALNVSVFSEKPWDNAPGGSRDTFVMLDTLEAPFGDIIALHDNHCYIPTVSAFDLSESNLFHNIAGDPQIMSKTPFDSIYWSADNYDHIYISPEVAAIIFDEIVATIPERQEIMLYAGWNGISSYLDPVSEDIPDLTQQLGDDLVIMQHFDEVYWPGGGINTLQNWNPNHGYVLKVLTDTPFIIQGQFQEDTTLQIQEGWNLIAVKTNVASEITQLFGGNLNKVTIIKEALGNQIYWPEFGITTLMNLQPGSTYFVKSTARFTVSF